MTMRVRITSDDGVNVRVVDAETGSEIGWVSDLQIMAPLGAPVTARLTVPLVGADVVCEADLVGRCPTCQADIKLLRAVGAPALQVDGP
jgi:hypothetical protein